MALAEVGAYVNAISPRVTGTTEQEELPAMTQTLVISAHTPGSPFWPVALIDDERPFERFNLPSVATYAEILLRRTQYAPQAQVVIEPNAYREMVDAGELTLATNRQYSRELREAKP